MDNNYIEDFQEEVMTDEPEIFEHFEEPVSKGIAVQVDDEYSWTRVPITDESKVIYLDMPEDELIRLLEQIGVTKKFDTINLTVVDMSPEELSAITARQSEQQSAEREAAYKSRRSKYLDAYRKYQASVNYGEYKPVPAVDVFIQALRNKDWSAFVNIPLQLAYFAGEVGFAFSGLEVSE